MNHVFCAECGTQMNAGAVFCDGCGHRVEGTPDALTSHSDELGTPTVDESATIMASTGAGARPTSGAPIFGEDAPTAEPYPRPYYAADAAQPAQATNRNRVLFGAGAAALLVAGFFGGSHLLSGGEDARSAQAAPATPAATASADPSKTGGGELSVPQGTNTQPTLPSADEAEASAAAAESERLAAEKAAAERDAALKEAADKAAAEKAAAQKAAREKAAREKAAREKAAAEKALRTEDDFPVVAQNYRMYHRISGRAGMFPRAATLSKGTTEPFLKAVADAYAASDANGGPAVLRNVYSSSTGETYKMTCYTQRDRTVLCWGGKYGRAEILLYKH